MKTVSHTKVSKGANDKGDLISGVQNLSIIFAAFPDICPKNLASFLPFLLMQTNKPHCLTLYSAQLAFDFTILRGCKLQIRVGETGRG